MKTQRLLAISDSIRDWLYRVVTKSGNHNTGKLQFDIAYPAAWIDAPLDGSQLPLAPYEIVIHLSNPDGLSQVKFRSMGRLLPPSRWIGRDDPGDHQVPLVT